MNSNDMSGGADGKDASDGTPTRKDEEVNKVKEEGIRSEDRRSAPTQTTGSTTETNETSRLERLLQESCATPEFESIDVTSNVPLSDTPVYTASEISSNCNTAINSSSRSSLDSRSSSEVDLPSLMDQLSLPDAPAIPKEPFPFKSISHKARLALIDSLKKLNPIALIRGVRYHFLDSGRVNRSTGMKREPDHGNTGSRWWMIYLLTDDRIALVVSPITSKARITVIERANQLTVVAGNGTIKCGMINGPDYHFVGLQFYEYTVEKAENVQKGVGEVSQKIYDDVKLLLDQFSIFSRVEDEEVVKKGFTAFRKTL